MIIPGDSPHIGLVADPAHTLEQLEGSRAVEGSQVAVLEGIQVVRKGQMGTESWGVEVAVVERQGPVGSWSHPQHRKICAGGRWKVKQKRG